MTSISQNCDEIYLKTPKSGRNARVFAKLYAKVDKSAQFELKKTLFLFFCKNQLISRSKTRCLQRNRDTIYLKTLNPAKTQCSQSNLGKKRVKTPRNTTNWADFTNFLYKCQNPQNYLELHVFHKIAIKSWNVALDTFMPPKRVFTLKNFEWRKVLKGKKLWERRSLVFLFDMPPSNINLLI